MSSFGEIASGSKGYSAWALDVEHALGDGNPAQGPQYIIFKDGASSYKARSGLTGKIPSWGSDSNACDLINNAIDDLYDTSDADSGNRIGGTIWFAPGYYYIDDTIYIKEDVQLTGGIRGGRESVKILLEDGADCTMIRNPTVTGYPYIYGMAISGLTLDGNRANQTDNTIDGIAIQNPGFLRIENVCVTNIRRNGIRIWGADNAGEHTKILNSLIYNCGVAGVVDGDGVKVEYYQYDVDIENCKIHHCEGNGIRHDTGGWITGNSIWHNTERGIMVGEGGGTGLYHIQDNIVDNNKLSAIYLYNTCLDSVITGNTMAAGATCTRYGIYLRDCNNIILKNNIARDRQDTPTQTVGFYIDTGCSKITMKGNRAYGNTADQYRFYSGTDSEWDGHKGCPNTLDLSGAAVSNEFIMHTQQDLYVTMVTILYAEASSADAGVTISIGSMPGHSPTYLYTGTSEVSKALWYTKKLIGTDLANHTVAAGDTIVCSTAGGKVGTGAVRFIVDYLTGLTI